VSSIFTPEQLAKLQTSGHITPQTAQGFTQKQPLGLRPALAGAAMNNMVSLQTAFQMPPGQAVPVITGDMPPQQTAKQYFAAKKVKDLQKIQRSEADVWASMQAKAYRVGPDMPPMTQAPLKVSNIPSDIAKKMQGPAAVGWRISDLDDDEYVLALRMAHANKDKMSPEEQTRVFDNFREVAAKRPELVKKLKAMLKKESGK